MNYRHLGKTGVQVSVIGIGCNQFGRNVDLPTTRLIAHRALDEGVNHFDTADAYGNGGSEEFLGDALAGQWQRVFLATKVRSKVGEGPNDQGASRYHILNGVEASLRRLKTDHIDLYYIHSWDAHTPVDETLRALDDLVHAGKVRYIAASNFDAWQLCHANAVAELHGWHSFVASQSHYNLLERRVEHELIAYLKFAGLGLIPYFPLAAGFLTGKYTRGETVSGRRVGYVSRVATERNFNLVDRLRSFAETRQHSLAELAVAWLLGQPTVASVICGATSPDQVSANVRAGDWVLNADEVKQVREIVEEHA
jgi:aryl-alcohol dehydrogenase-like predicted oxidoreductase